jgi:hypothetical protein
MMIKKIGVSVTLFILSFMLTYAAQTKVSVKNYDKIELYFENVLIDEICFTGYAEIKIEFDSDDSVTVKQDGKKVIITASEEKTRIRMILPKDKTYYYNMQASNKDAYCKFTQEYFYLYESGNKVISLAEGVLLINDDDTTIRVDDEKIYIRNDDGKETEISSNGIITSNNEDEDQSDGFWGKIIGNAIQFGVHLAITKIADSPSAMAKLFINSDLDENIEINFD